jgi:hypothetical protein
MRKREQLLLFMSIGLLLGGAACWLLMPPSPTSQINRASFDAIRVGMSEAEVEEILGGPAGDYCTGDVIRQGDLIVGPVIPLWTIPPSKTNVWQGDEGELFLIFDLTGQVLDKFFMPTTLRDPPFREKLRRWLGL